MVVTQNCCCRINQGNCDWETFIGFVNITATRRKMRNTLEMPIRRFCCQQKMYVSLDVIVRDFFLRPIEEWNMKVI